ncbi:phosphoenolpyruvate--protein phosphotransferase [Alistipes sp.]|uniref:phosphoenolpyruvate--protein phosphotransferase n=1 Tax=Alistipes sp. TaxID=1872444 RepID=UPI0011C938F3
MTRIRTNTATTQGIVVGTAYVVRHPEPEGEPHVADSATDALSERTRFERALARAAEQLGELIGRSDVFSAHLAIAEDPMLRESVETKIEEGMTAERAVESSCAEISGMMEELEDEYLRERATDVRDVCTRIRQALRGTEAANPFANLGPEAIVVADELTPSDTAMMDFSRIVGFVTRGGSTTSHVCIIARNQCVLAMVGVGDDIARIETGDRLILDGIRGEILIDPDPATEEHYRRRAREIETERLRLMDFGRLRAVTTDGRPVAVFANVANTDEVRTAIDAGADGIGLYRSEFLYMLHPDDYPDEQTQFEAYRAAAELCGERSLIIRTLDIGGDKALPYMHAPREENPFLGWRAVRISLSMPELFEAQIRALLRASAYGNVKIMFPMITSLDEFRRAREVVERCKAALGREGIAFNPAIETGIMVETPAAVLTADLLAAEADFFSIGTNDLTQYVMAADRTNPRVSHLYDTFNLSVLRSIRSVIDAGAEAGREVGMCGEFASDPLGTRLLLGLGLQEFSVNIGVIGSIKACILRQSYAACREFAARVLEAATEERIHALIAEEDREGTE